MEVISRTIGEHSLTTEMDDIITAVIDGSSVKGIAYAGAGKSTLLRAIEKYHKKKIGIYICYNKSLEREARKLFKGNNVHIFTAHAYSLNSLSVVDKTSFLNKVSLTHTRDTVFTYSGLETDNEYFTLLDMNKNWRVLINVVDQYISTASLELSEIHLTEKANGLINKSIKFNKIKSDKKQEVFNYVVNASKRLAKAILDPTNNCPCTHDTYLKRWQLSNPKIDYDYIMFDEAQDANPVLLSVILKQPCQQIFVGDQYQSIYQFRGGVNAMKIIPHDAYPLSNSFRYGKKIADLATKILRHSDESITISGLGYDTEIIKGSEYTGTEPFLYISHTNIDLLDKLISCYQANVPATFTSNKAEATLQKARSMVSLKLHGKGLIPAHKKYTRVEEVLLVDKSLETQIIGQWLDEDELKVALLIKALNWTLDITTSQSLVSLTTAHMSKGLEHDTVILSDDFTGIIASFNEGKPLPEEELNLFYVAVTRAKKTLVIPDELYAALQENLAFTLKKYQAAKCLMDNLLPEQAKERKSTSGATKPQRDLSLESSPRIVNQPSSVATQTNQSPTKSINTPPPESANEKAAVRKPNAPIEVKTKTGNICITVGSDKETGNPLYWEPTNTNEYLNPNLAVVGTMGTGKTQTVKSIVTQLRQQRHLNTDGESIGILIFDYKSDYVDDEFINTTNAEVLDNYNIPINPFELFTRDRRCLMNTARVFVSTVTKAYRLGNNQEHTLKNCILSAYENKGIDKDDLDSFDNTPPTMRDIIAIASSLKKGVDGSLEAALSDLHEDEIFEPNARKCQSLYNKLDDNVVVIKLGGLDSKLQNLIVSVMLDQFYIQMHQSPKPKAHGVHRALKKLVLVDEADNFMSQDFASLRKILKEGREFGVGCLLSTQGLDHFVTSENTYSDYVTAWVAHRLNNPKPKDVSQLLNTGTKNELDARMTEVRGLEKHHSLFVNGRKEVIYQESTAFWSLAK